MKYELRKQNHTNPQIPNCQKKNAKVLKTSLVSHEPGNPKQDWLGASLKIPGSSFYLSLSSQGVGEKEARQKCSHINIS